MTNTAFTVPDAAAPPVAKKHPSVAPLYFSERRNNLDDDAMVSTVTTASMVASTWPSELWNKCLIEYSDWGEVARLSCVQLSWRNLLWDAAHANDDDSAKWQCAIACLDGTHGLATNPIMAVQLLQELATISPHDWNMLQLQLKKEEEEFDTTVMELVQEEETEMSATVNNDKPCYRAAAMRRMADLYLNGGLSASQSTTTAPTNGNSAVQTGLLWLQAAFQIGKDVTAAHDVAVLLEKGLSSKQDENDDDDETVVANHDDETLAANGTSDAGIPIDVVASGRWFFKAARAGHVESMAELALLYELGIGGMVQSDEHALFWYRQAALRGHTTSKYSVGEALEEARGVPHSDVEEACLWYYKAALDGDEDGRHALRRLADVATRMRLVVAPEAALLDE